MSRFNYLPSAVAAIIWGIAGDAVTAVLWVIVTGLVFILEELQKIRRSVVPPVESAPHEQRRPRG